jgi:hypothetical protein
MTTMADGNDDSAATAQASSNADRPLATACVPSDGQDFAYAVPRVRLAVWMVDT